MKKHPGCVAILFLSMGLASAVAGQLKEFTSLLSFDGTNGAEPWGKLIQETEPIPFGNGLSFGSGVIYGTTYSGGISDGGTIFSLFPDGTLSTLHYFSIADGGLHPGAGLLQASDGFLYGTTTDGLTNAGIIFRISSLGRLISPILPLTPMGKPTTPAALQSIPITIDAGFTNLHEFSAVDGAHPWAGPLVQGRDGFLYGTTEAGGSDDIGSIFQISTNGSFNSLCSLNGAEGHIPYGGLIEGLDGNFYGTTSVGAPGKWGTIFKVTPSGAYADLFSFSGSDGAIPFGGLVQGADGNLYGTTTQGGPSYGDPNSVNGQGYGTIFKTTTNGVLTTLFSFAGTNGSYPYGPLTQASDGKLYGTTLSGGPYTNDLFGGTGYAGYGTLFCITTNGEFTTLYSFDKTNGADPFATPLQVADGTFYGTTALGGAYDLGTVYHFRVSLPPSLGAPTVITNECGRIQSLFFAHITNYDDTAMTAVWSVNQQPVETNALQPVPITYAFFPGLSALPLGTNIVSLTCTDADGNTAAFSTIIKVVDTIPPVIASAWATPDVLWPPRGQMVNVEVLAILQDSCSHAAYKIISVDSPGLRFPKDGRTTYWQITGDHTVVLRAERGPRGRDRVYNITLQATDSSGNVSLPKIVTVTVSKNQPGAGQIRR